MTEHVMLCSLPSPIRYLQCFSSQSKHVKVSTIYLNNYRHISVDVQIFMLYNYLSFWESYLMLIQFAVRTYMNLCYPDIKIERIRFIT